MVVSFSVHTWNFRWSAMLVLTQKLTPMSLADIQPDQDSRSLSLRPISIPPSSTRARAPAVMGSGTRTVRNANGRSRRPPRFSGSARKKRQQKAFEIAPRDYCSRTQKTHRYPAVLSEAAVWEGGGKGTGRGRWRLKKVTEKSIGWGGKIYLLIFIWLLCVRVCFCVSTVALCYCPFSSLQGLFSMLFFYLKNYLLSIDGNL